MINLSELNDKILQEALSLPSHLRTQLIDELIRSLNVPIQEEVDKLWDEEIERRLSEIESGKTKLIPGEQVFKDIRNQFDK